MSQIALFQLGLDKTEVVEKFTPKFEIEVVTTTVTDGVILDEKFPATVNGRKDAMKLFKKEINRVFSLNE